MIIQAELRRKQSEYEGEACSVDIGNTEYETVRLRRLLTGRKPITEPDAELLQSTVSKVRVTNKCVTVTLKNGQVIERRDEP